MVSTSNFVFVPSLYSIYLSIITVSIPMNGLDVLNPRPAAPPAHTQDARRRMGQGDWRWYQLPRPTPVLYVRSQLLVLSLPNSAPVHAKVSVRSRPYGRCRIAPTASSIASLAIANVTTPPPASCPALLLALAASVRRRRLRARCCLRTRVAYRLSRATSSAPISSTISSRRRVLRPAMNVASHE